MKPSEYIFFKNVITKYFYADRVYTPYKHENEVISYEKTDNFDTYNGYYDKSMEFKENTYVKKNLHPEVKTPRLCHQFRLYIPICP